MADNTGLPSFVRLDKEKLLFNGSADEEFLAYIPEKYFERKIAEVVGEYIDILGIFEYTVTNTKTGKNIGLKPFRFPTVFSTRPDKIEKVKDVILTEGSSPSDYRVLHYEKDGEIATSVDVVQYVGNIEKLMNLFYILGYIPNTIPYDKIHEILMDNIALNGSSYELNAQMFGFTISEMCRSTKDPNIPFRLSGSKNMHDYKSMSVKNISKLVSPYTAIISEDFDESLMYAMLNNTPKDTPLEKVLVGE